MNFEHTHERRMLAQSLSRYLAGRYEEAPRRLVPRPAGAPFDATHWRALADLGAVGALVDPAHGGYGGSPFDVMAVFEEIGRGLATEPFLASLMAVRVLTHGGTAVHEGTLAGIVDGSVIATLAHCEPGGQWDPDDVQCTARRDGAHWVIDGRRAGVPAGGEADLLVVSARTPDGGVSLFAVPAAAGGVVRRAWPGLDGSSLADLDLRSVALDVDALLGEPGQGGAALGDAIAHGILALCAEALGAMDSMMASTLDYLKARKQFGAPIGSFQAVQHRMVDLMLHVEQSRSAALNCAMHMDAGDLLRDRHAAAAKYTVGTAALQLAQECIQLHGGIGMTWELPLSHYSKRLAILNLQLGDEDHHLRRFVELSR